MRPAFPVDGTGVVTSKGRLLLGIIELLAVSVPPCKAMLPAGAAPVVSARIFQELAASVCAVIVIAPGIVAALPPEISLLIQLLSKLTLVAELPGPLTP